MRPASPIRPDIVTCDAHTVPNNAHTLLNSAQTVLNSAHTVLSSALYWTVLNSAHTVLNSAHCSEQCTHYWTVHSVPTCTHYHSVLSLYCSAHSVLNSAHSTEQCLLYWTMHTVLNRAHTVLDSANTVLNSAIFTAVHTYATCPHLPLLTDLYPLVHIAVAHGATFRGHPGSWRPMSEMGSHNNSVETTGESEKVEICNTAGRNWQRGGLSYVD